MECFVASDWEIDEKIFNEEINFYSKEVETTIPNITYKMSLDSNDEYDKIELVIFVEKNTPISTNLTFSIPSARFSVNYNMSFSSNIDNDVVHTFSRQTLLNPNNGYIRNGKLILQIRGTIKCKEYDEIKNTPMGQFFWRKNDKDFTIEIGNEEIKVHKFILRERSPVFAAMFDSGMKEALENKVKIDGFPVDVVKHAILYCYDWNDEEYYKHLSIDNFLHLLKFCEMYNFEELKANVELRMQKKLSPENVCGILNVSIEHNLKNLRLCCMNYLIQCARTSIAITDFDSLDANLKAEFADKIVCLKI